MNFRSLILLGLTLSLGASFAACGDLDAKDSPTAGADAKAKASAAPPAKPPTPVRAMPIVQQNVANHRLATGSLRAESMSSVASQVSGQVMSMFVREGQSVAKGEALAMLDTRRIDAQIVSANARIKVAKANLDIFSAELKGKTDDLEAYHRANEKKAGAVSDMVLREVGTEISTLNARVALTNAEVESLEAQLEEFAIQKRDARIVAPFDSIVIKRHAEPGQWLSIGTPVAMLSSTGFLEAVLDVEESVPMDVVDGMESLTIHVPAMGISVKSQSHSIVRDVDDRARRYRVVAKVFQNGGIAPGMSVSAFLPTSKVGPRLVIDSNALMRDAVGYLAMKAQPVGPGAFLAMPVRMNLDFTMEDGRAVVSAVEEKGLNIGDLLITEGNIRLFPMSPVMLLNAAELEMGGTGTKPTVKEGSGMPEGTPVKSPGEMPAESHPSASEGASGTEVINPTTTTTTEE